MWVKRTFSDSISGVSGLMSAFLQSGRSDAPKSTKSKVRFRPEADLLRRKHPDLSRRIPVEEGGLDLETLGNRTVTLEGVFAGIEGVDSATGKPHFIASSTER